MLCTGVSLVAKGASDSKEGQRQGLDSQEESNPYDGKDTAGGPNTGSSPRRVRIGDNGRARFKLSTNHQAMYRDTEPRAILDNKSSYRVSYWVVEENKNATTSNKVHAERLVESMRRSLNASSDARGSKWAKAEDGEEKGVYFLTRDHRMDPRGRTQATKIPFPVRCQKMRVWAFFEEDGRWHCFQDRKVSIGLFKKVFTITALDADIAPYAKHRCKA